MSYSITISGIPGASGNVYACSSSPITTSQVSSYAVGNGAVNSSGAVTWSTTPTSGSRYIVVYYDSTYYKYSGSVSFPLSYDQTLSWSGFNAMVNPTTLNSGAWARGNIASSGGEQYFQFTATASTQYIHVTFGTLSDLYVQLYDSSNAVVGSQTNLFSSTTSVSRSVTSGRTYYIRVWPFSSSASGGYQIAFNASSTPPAVVEPITLASGAWTTSSIASGGEQWFQFTATASTQYIHVNFGTLTDLYVQLYDSLNAAVGDQTNLYGSTTSVSRSVTSGQTYYIRVWPFSSSASGGFQIAFNTSSTAP
jgi:hypothetical protein